MSRVFENINFGYQSPHSGMTAVIERVKQNPGDRKYLLPYLLQQHPEYRGKSANEVKRKRAFLFEAFQHTGLPESALPFILEALETEHHALLVAGAAMALRGLPEPRVQVVGYLMKAIQNIKFADDTVCFESSETNPFQTGGTTALLEICKTFQWLGSVAINAIPQLRLVCADDYINERVKTQFEKAIQTIGQDDRKNDRSCCDLPLIKKDKYSFFDRKYKLKASLNEVLLQDHDGKKVTFSAFFTGKPSAVVFFYTRCDNPNKCSLTISRIKSLQRDLQSDGLGDKIKIAAISYDPSHDDPLRIKAYCDARAMKLDHDHRAFRVECGMDSVLRYFDSGVSYMGSLVNHHTTELFLLDHHGAITGRHKQLQWETKDVVADLKKLADDQKSTLGNFNSLLKSKVNGIASPMLSFFIVFFPKCPLCWAAYLSVFGITNIHLLKFASRMQPLLIVLLLINLYALYKVARRRNGLLPFCISLAGLACILFSGSFLELEPLGYTGIGLMLAGALMNSLPHGLFNRFRLGFSRLLDMNFRPNN